MRGGGGGYVSLVVWVGGWEAGYDVRRRWACLTVVAGVSYAGEKGGGGVPFVLSS